MLSLGCPGPSVTLLPALGSSQVRAVTAQTPEHWKGHRCPAGTALLLASPSLPPCVLLTLSPRPLSRFLAQQLVLGSRLPQGHLLGLGAVLMSPSRVCRLPVKLPQQWRDGVGGGGQWRVSSGAFRWWLETPRGQTSCVPCSLSQESQAGIAVSV